MASKANKTQTDDTDNGDAPLLDLNEASVKKLISRAKKRGYITYDELNNALPQDQMSSEQIEDVMAALNDKIGRASCRERVCQYVSISVVAVSFTKQENKHDTTNIKIK